MLLHYLAASLVSSLLKRLDESWKINVFFSKFCFTESRKFIWKLIKCLVYHRPTVSTGMLAGWMISQALEKGQCPPGFTEELSQGLRLSQTVL